MISRIKKCFKLSKKEKSELTKILHSTTKAAIYRRAEIILTLDSGETPTAIANRFHISRQVIYKWLYKFQADQDKSINERLLDGKRFGRPKRVSGIIDPWILEVIDSDPRDYNYNSTTWTAKLLNTYIQDKYNIAVSTNSVRLALDRLEFHWKRPRYILSKRSPNWKRKKGA